MGHGHIVMVTVMVMERVMGIHEWAHPQLASWLVSWLAGWLVDWLVVWLVGRV